MRDLTRLPREIAMLECARTFQNYRAIVALGHNILRYYCWQEKKREKKNMHRETESAFFKFFIFYLYIYPPDS